MHLVMWIFVGAIVVLIIKNASSFATAVNAVGSNVLSDASLLAGYAPAAKTQSFNQQRGAPYILTAA